MTTGELSHFLNFKATDSDQYCSMLFSTKQHLSSLYCCTIYQSAYWLLLLRKSVTGLCSGCRNFPKKGFHLSVWVFKFCFLSCVTFTAFSCSLSTIFWEQE